MPDPHPTYLPSPPLTSQEKRNLRTFEEAVERATVIGLTVEQNESRDGSILYTLYDDRRLIVFRSHNVGHIVAAVASAEFFLRRLAAAHRRAQAASALGQ